MTDNTTGNSDAWLTLTPKFPVETILREAENQSPFTPEETVALERLKASGLPPILRPEILVEILGISPKLLSAMAHVPGNYYRFFTIPKRNGTLRSISSPRVFLKVVQTWILRNILQRIDLPEFVTGFIP